MTRKAGFDFASDTLDVVDDVFDGSEYKNEKRKDAVPKARKALRNMAQKVFNKIETMWYICGSASRGNY